MLCHHVDRVSSIDFEEKCMQPVGYNSVAL